MASIDTPASTGVDEEADGLYRGAVQSAETGSDPYPQLRELVRNRTFHVSPTGNSYVYGYHLAQTTLRSPALLKGGQHVSSFPAHLSPEQRAILAEESPDDPGMLSAIDDPDHARLRRLVSIAFTPRAVEQYRSVVAQAVDEGLSALPTDEVVDLLDTICIDVPTQVIGHLIGVPLPERRHFAALSRLQAASRDPGSDFATHLDGVRARKEVFAYIAELIDGERKNPRDNPLGRLVQLEAAGEKISGAELVSLVSLMYSGAFGTTMRTLSNGFVALMKHPDQAAALRSDPALTRQATDEVLRYDTSVMTVGYIAGEGAEIEGVALSPGTQVTVVLGACNYDPRVFSSPEIFDVTRVREESPLSFGHGTHYCLGVNLSKLEVDVVLGAVLRRFPKMQLSEEPERKPSFRSREFTRVPVILGPEAQN